MGTLVQAKKTLRLAKTAMNNWAEVQKVKTNSKKVITFADWWYLIYIAVLEQRAIGKLCCYTSHLHQGKD